MINKTYTAEELASLEKGAANLLQDSSTISPRAKAWNGYTENGADICCVAEIAQTWRGSAQTETFRYKFHQLKEIGKPETKGRQVARAKLLRKDA
jgi:hypothetical protein